MFEDLDQKVYNELMKDPKKRAFVLSVIESEKRAMEELKRKEKEQKSIPHFDSPASRLRRRELAKRDKGYSSDSSNSDPSIPKIPQKKTDEKRKVPTNELLKGIIAYVEVKKDGEDKSEKIRIVMLSMGADVRNTFTRDVTHVVFKDGSYTTFQKAKLLKIHLVSVLWLDAVKRNQCRVPENDFPAFDNSDLNSSLFCSQIQKDYEDIVRDEARRSLLIQNSQVSSQLKRYSIASCSASSSYHTPDAPDVSFISKINQEVIEAVNKSKEPFVEVLEPELTSDDSDCGVVDSFSSKHLKEKYCSQSCSDMDAVVIKETMITKAIEKKARKSLFSDNSKQKQKSTESVHPDKRRRTVANAEKFTVQHVENKKNENSENELSSLEKNHIFKKLDQKGSSDTSNEESGDDLAGSKLMNSPLIGQNKRKKPLDSFDDNDSLRNTDTTKSTENSKSIQNRRNRRKINKENTIMLDSESETPSTIEKNRKSKIFSKKSISVNRDLSDVENSSNLNDSQLSSTKGRRGRPRKSSVLTKIENVHNKNDKTANRENSDNNMKEIEGSEASISLRSEERKSLLVLSNIVVNSPEKNNIDNSSIRTDSRMSSRTRRGKNSDLSTQITESFNSTKNIEMSPLQLSEIKESESNKLKETPPDTRELVVKLTEMTPEDINKVTRRKKETAKRLILETSQSDTGTETDSSEGTKRKKRQLYNPNDEVHILNKSPECDELERQERKKRVAPPEDRLFKNPNLVLPSALSTNTNMNSEKNVEEDSHLDSDSDLLLQIFSENSRKPVKKNEPTNESYDSELDEQKDLKREILSQRRSGRLSQCKRLNYKELSSGSLTPRRSSVYFEGSSQKTTQSSKKKSSVNNKLPSIVCTKMHRPQNIESKIIVQKLGSFVIEDFVTDRTTHLVAGEPKRTINMLKAIARGCWVLKQEWLFKSRDAGRWLPEEDFELTEFSSAVQNCRLQRQAFGPTYSMDIFSNCGLIYIANNTVPPSQDLIDLVLLCKGQLTSMARNAKIVVGQKVAYDGVVCVTEYWILDSITFNRCKTLKHYLIQTSHECMGSDSPTF